MLKFIKKITPFLIITVLFSPTHGKTTNNENHKPQQNQTYTPIMSSDMDNLYFQAMQENFADLPIASEVHLRFIMNDQTTPFLDLVKKYLDTYYGDEEDARKIMKDETSSFKELTQKIKENLLNGDEKIDIKYDQIIPTGSRDIINEILEEEQKNKERIVVYHSTPFEVGVIIDILSTLRSILAQQKSFSYRWDSAFKEIDNTIEYLEVGLNQKGGWANQTDKVLCSNLSLFANHKNDGESTFYFWMFGGGGVSSPPFDKVFKPILKNLGLPEELYKEYEKFLEIINKENLLKRATRLLQFFVNSSDIDKVGYVYHQSLNVSGQKNVPFPLRLISSENNQNFPIPIDMDFEQWKTYNLEQIGDMGETFIFKQDNPVAKLFYLTNKPSEILKVYRSTPYLFEKIFPLYYKYLGDYINLVYDQCEKEKGWCSKLHDAKNTMMWRHDYQLAQINNCFNRMQFRILIKPELVNNPNIIKIKKYWQIKQDPQKEEEYKKKLYTLVSKHVNMLIHKKDPTTLEGGKVTLFEDMKKTSSDSPVGNLDLEPIKPSASIQQIKGWIQGDNLAEFQKYFNDPNRTQDLFDELSEKEMPSKYLDLAEKGTKSLDQKYNIFSDIIEHAKSPILNFVFQKLLSIRNMTLEKKIKMVADLLTTRKKDLVISAKEKKKLEMLLLLAFNNDKFEQVSMLLDLGIQNPKITYKDLLFKVLATQEIDLIKKLDFNKFDLNSLNEKGETPLFKVVITGTTNIPVSIAEILLKYQADPNKGKYNLENKQLLYTPLEAAAGMGKTQMVQLLLKYGATVTDTAIEMAKKRRYVDIVEILLKAQEKK